ncbi:MAG: methyl-accepting chemotaxis protein [Gomphosphaeria aponina SAG 52.96 = DSM 107014]|uniref:Methyl-accepting chemotaxis protein n=1 Tax=Gomphosphaeria aponina SAG 52.96 = DSM 107014 TaxID=1521640 RepID=A0A941JVL2_9CHRO|nr:methyl-accepting chemotaxis protein [Gomphosphaeria aponina SAG 52.96 = DSM 107014]
MTITEEKIKSIAPEKEEQKKEKGVGAFISSHLVETITVSVVTSLVLFGASVWNTWSIYRGFRSAVTREFRLQELSGKIVHLDEVLTMSARMAASTGDLKWEERYQSFEPELAQSIEEVLKTSPESYQQDAAATDAANIKLIELETQAFELVEQGKSKEALALLLGEEYQTQKEIYAQGINNTLATIKQEAETQLKAYSDRLFTSLVFAGVSLPILMVSWLSILQMIKAYIRDRNAAQDSLLASEAQLRQINLEIEERQKQIITQEQATKAENELLESDVGHILDVVSAAEEGDLTIVATVSDRPTGLVADTINRFLEELGRVILAVLQTASQVQQGARELEKLATTTEYAVTKQNQSVEEVEGLMKQVTKLSENSLEQAFLANQAVEQAQSAVAQGEQEIKQMSLGIASLEQGTVQIVKRLETLRDFVDLAAGFARDQKRVAALTRVLALNASMIAARASEQQDPEQFASIAREFETIATQVNDLAVATNDSLIILQQRTDQIETVVSGLDLDVQEINQVVNDFTMEVKQSRQAFDNIKTITNLVVKVEQEVTKASEAIATVAMTTLQSIQDIALVARETESYSSVTREQSGQMGQMAASLLEIVKFFRLNNMVDS